MANVVTINRPDVVALIEEAAKRLTNGNVSPASMRAMAFLPLMGIQLGRPNLTPRTLARSRPSPVRVAMRERSNSVRPPNTVSINRPCGVFVWGKCRPTT
jgi:hypothetical protein